MEGDQGGIGGTLATVGAQTAGEVLSGVIAGGMSARKSMELAKYAYSRDLEMWNRQNEYNLPANQMKRLIEAGLNPNIAFGGAVNTAKEMPRFNAPTARYDINIPDMMSMLSSYQDIKVKQAQADNIKAQTDFRLIQNRVASETILEQIERIRGESTSAQFRGQMDHLRFLIENYLYGDEKGGEQIIQRRAEIKKSQADAERASSEAQLKKLELGIYDMLDKVSKDSDTARFLNQLLKMVLIKF